MTIREMTTFEDKFIYCNLCNKKTSPLMKLFEDMGLFVCMDCFAILKEHYRRRQEIV